MNAPEEFFNYTHSCSLDDNIEIKVGPLRGIHSGVDYEQMLADLMLKFSGLNDKSSAEFMLECQVYSGGRSISLPVRELLTVSFAPTSFSTHYDWITLPVKLNDLPRDALLAITLYDCIGATAMKPVGGTTIKFFSKHGVFRQGVIDLRVWPDCVADGRDQSETPGKVCHDGAKQNIKLEKLAKKHREGHLQSVDWMDRMAHSNVENMKETEKRRSDHIYLTVEFQKFHTNNKTQTVVFFEKDGDELHQFKYIPDIVVVYDPEDGLENLIENKHHCLTRSVNSKMTDMDAKPNADMRDKLNAIMAYPPTKQLTSDDQDHVWKYRFYLATQGKALSKFLYCVNWEHTGEEQQAIDMLQRWVPMAVEDALQLLGPAFTHKAVRRYAISRLQQASDDDLLLYLLQLVQALKYEDYFEINESYKAMQLKDYTTSETEMKRLPSLFANTSIDSHVCKNNSEIGKGEGNNLAIFLIDRACHNSNLANYFHWYLITQCEDQDVSEIETKARDMYLTVLKMFQNSLQVGCPEWQSRQQMLQRQVILIDELVKLVKNVQRENCSRIKKIAQLQSLIADGEAFKINLSDFEPITFPLDPAVTIKGIIPHTAILFKSNLMPLKLTFKTTDGTEYVAIFKHGDDLRQDQFVLQIITLMEKLLRTENLDLRLTPYRVLATGTRHGFVQYISSLTIAEVLAKEVTIRKYLRKNHPSVNGPFGISSDIMDTYVRSCAGYCVITYILGVGDRHLDNLLLTSSGKLFHIDFGYILGRDPKPFPPPMKLSKEMVEAMGGMGSVHYKEFERLCYTAFLTLRRNANVILNLFSLMVNANVPDIALESDKAIQKVQDNLCLDKGDEEAVQYFKHLLDTSVTAVMAAVMDQFHKCAQYWRK